MATTTLKVEGMSCDHCVHAVGRALGALDGVQSADVSLERGEATVRYDEQRVDRRALVRAVLDEGYTAEERA